MAMEVDRFIENFHNLDGITIDRKKRSLNCLLHQSNSLKDNEEALTFLFENLAPTTHLEAIFRVDVLIYFRRKQELFELLKDGNDEIVSKIAKHEWFFRELFDNVSVEVLVNDVLPSLSYIVRNKVIEMLGRCFDGAQFDPIFDCLVKRYGIHKIIKFNKYCSSNKIAELIHNETVYYKDRELKSLYYKDRNLIDIYYQKYKNRYGDNKKWITFILNEDFDFYLKLEKKYDSDWVIQFGRRSSKKLLSIKKDKIISGKYLYHLKTEVVVRKLQKDDLEKLYANLMPKRIPNASREISKIQWKYLPRKLVFPLFKRVYETNYNMKLEANLEDIGESLLKLINDSKERQKYAQLKVDAGNDEYWKYLPTEISIPKIKEQIYLTSKIWERKKLLMRLVQTCKINNDSNALHEVLQYYVLRHKNEESATHEEFMYEIGNFGWHKMNKEMWQLINELWTIQKLKFNIDPNSTAKYAYLEFQFNRNELVDDLIESWIDITHQYSWDLIKNNPELEKRILLFAINRDPPINSNNKELDDFFIISQIERWNDRHKNDEIHYHMYPRLVQSLQKLIHDKKYFANVSSFVQNSVCTNKKQIFGRDEFLKVYWKFFGRYFNYKNTMWFLKFDPMDLRDHFDRFMEVVFDSYLHNFQRKMIARHVKKYGHLRVDGKAIDFCKQKLGKSSCDKGKIVEFLAIITSPEDYEQFCHTYKPISKKFDVNSVEQKELYELQCSLASNLKHVQSYRILPTLLDFCGGDYFGSALKSLSSVLCRTPEEQLAPVMGVLSKEAISVRKHVIFFTCELSDCAAVMATFKRMAQTEKNLSLRKYLVSSTIKYFTKNPSRQMLDYLKEVITFIDKNDTESMSTFVDMKSIPKSYRAEYLEFIWKFIEQTVDVTKKRNDFKDQLLRNICDFEFCDQLSVKFCDELIDQHFLVYLASNVDIESSTNKVVSKYVLYHPENDQSKIAKVFGKLNREFATENDKCMSFLQLFFFNLTVAVVFKTIHTKDLKTELITALISNLETLINPFDHFKFYVALHIFKLRVFESHESIIIAKVSEFVDRLVESYSPFVINSIIAVIEGSISTLVGCTCIYTFCESLLDANPSLNICIIVISLLPTEQSDEYNKALQDKVVERLRKISHPAITINLKIRKLDK